MENLKRTLFKATLEAGQIISNNFGGNFQIDHKEGINNLVTEVDKQSEAAIIAIIRAQYPNHSILTEESSGHETDSEYTWIIDPIDGTVNFAHHIPICCVSIGVKKGQQMLMGTVYNPMMDELFFAEKGKGAFLNEKPIQVSMKNNFETACLVTGFPYEWSGNAEKHPIKVFEKIVRKGIPVRRLGSAALDLCWVACGRFDGFWEYRLNPWDIAAGYLIVTEAGGKVTNFKGAPYTVFDQETLATNGLIHHDMLMAITA